MRKTNSNHIWSVFSILVAIALVALPAYAVSGSLDNSLTGPEAVSEPSANFDRTGMDDLSVRLVEMGYRPRFPYPGSPTVQTPSPAPEGAVVLPYGQVPAVMNSAPTRASWDLYYSDTILDVYVDISSGGGGALSSQEKTLLDTIIADFVNISFPRVKEWFDPLDRITGATFYIHQIDGRSGTGGYFQPGTDEFHVDRADMDWAGEIAAHEFQHYIHDEYDRYENLWINEGCADYAAYLVYGYATVLASHLAVYLSYYPYSTLPIDDYSFYNDGTTRYYGVSFAYQLYMAYHYGGKNWTNALIRSTGNGATGVNTALSTLGYSDRFQDTFEKWMVATRINDRNTGTDGEYSYQTSTYPYGYFQTDLMATYNNFPVDVTRGDSSSLRGWGPQSFRFTAPQGPNTNYRLKLSVSTGTIMVAMYQERPTNPRPVVFLHEGGNTVQYDFTGWGKDYNAFQLIIASTDQSTLRIDLDVLDLDPPVTTYGINPSTPDGLDGWYITSPWVTLRSESGARLFYTLDGGEATSYTQSIFIPDGSHNLSYWAVDARDNVELPRYLDFKVDTGVPKTDVTIEPPVIEDKWYTEAPTITLGVKDPLATVMFRWDQESYRPYSGPLLAPEGEHTLTWKAMDQAGNEEPPVNQFFRVDTTLPVVTYQVYPSSPSGLNGWYTTPPLVTLSGDPKDTLYFRIDGQDYAGYIASITMPEGIHTLRAVSVDQAGNMAEEIVLDFKVDTIDPAISGTFEGLDYSLSNASDWFNSRPVLKIEGTEDDMEINYSFNGARPVAYNGPIQVPEGANRIEVRGRDKAGNEAESLIFLVNIDTKAPQAYHTVTSTVHDGWLTDARAKVELTLKNEEATSSPAVIYYSWDGIEYKTYRTPITIPEGENELRYYARDQAGNVLQIAEVDIRLDSVQPTIVMDVQGPVDGTLLLGEEIILDLSGSSDASDGLTFYAELGDGRTVQWQTSSVITHTYTSVGTYEVVVKAKDRAGNTVMAGATIVVKEEEGEYDTPSEKDDTTLVIVAGIIIGLLLISVIILAVVLVTRRRGQEDFQVQAPPPRRNIR